MLRRFIVLSILSVILHSCDYAPSVKGIVISNSTKKPIGGAHIEFVDQEVSTLSDKNGFFEVSTHAGFYFAPQLRISKPNYKPFEFTISDDKGAASYKVASNYQDIQFDKPFYPDPNNKSTFMIGVSIQKYSQYFTITSDTILFYLDTVDLKGEVSRIQSKLKTK